MTKDEVTRVRVRVETALTGLREALTAAMPAVQGDDDQEISDSLEEALQAAETARAALVNIIGF